ncbi:unnamed protein product, partial [Adineta steineri]
FFFYFLLKINQLNNALVAQTNSSVTNNIRKLYDGRNYMGKLINGTMNGFGILLPRSMIPEAVFHQSPVRVLSKLAISGRNPTRECRDTASMKFPEYYGTGRFRAELLDLDIS